jgi:hypothetical protein
MRKMKRIDRPTRCSFLAAALLLLSAPVSFAQRIEVTIPATKPLTGHLVLVFAEKNQPEPRFQLSDDYLSAVNSANVGPYGTAINEEPLPAIEQKYRAVPQRRAHATFGGSTGGPAEYTMEENNGTWTQRVLPEMVAHMLATAPKGADTTSWRY